MKYLRPYIKKYKMQSILAPAFKMLEAAFDLTVPLLVAMASRQQNNMMM